MLAGYLRLGQCALEGRPVYECMGEYTVDVQFFKFLIKFDQSQTTESYLFNDIKIDQSHISDAKIASKDKMPLMAK